MADIKKLSLLAPAKINPFLEVSKKREDGYHDIVTVMQTVSLYDEIELTADTKFISVSVENHPELSGEDNIVYGAIKKFFEVSGLKSCASASIKKNIPISAGLGGGSADAAAVLKGLNRLYGGVLSENELFAVGKSLGADIPFCIKGDCAVAKGIGEILIPCPPLTNCFIVIAISGKKESTGSMYAKLDELGNRKITSEDAFVKALSKGDLKTVGKLMYNAFSYVNATDKRIEDAFSSCGALGSCVSGSGPSFIGLFDDEEKATRAKDALLSLGIQSYSVTPVIA